jgi:hypothetical protein
MLDDNFFTIDDIHTLPRRTNFYVLNLASNNLRLHGK